MRRRESFQANHRQVEREKVSIAHMVSIYCRGQRHTASGLCSDCGRVLRYAYQRIDGCPYHDRVKPACGLCRVNCFTPQMHRQFAAIMRYAGPRMMLRHPLLTLAHLRDALRGKSGGEL